MYLADGREGMVIMRRDATVYNKRTPARISIKIKRELKETIDCIVIGANPPTKLYNGKSIETWQYWVNDITDERLELKSHYKEYKEGAPIVPVTKNYYLKMAGSFRLGLLDHDGMVRRYGDLSGLTEEMLTNWRDYLNVVVEVGGMMLDSATRTIRHPKLIRIREDKEPYDCTEDQLIN
jgi:ATP-dependent DNA ligase